MIAVHKLLIVNIKTYSFPVVKIRDAVNEKLFNPLSEIDSEIDLIQKMPVTLVAHLKMINNGAILLHRFSRFSDIK